MWPFNRKPKVRKQIAGLLRDASVEDIEATSGIASIAAVLAYDADASDSQLFELACYSLARFDHLLCGVHVSLRDKVLPSMVLALFLGFKDTCGGLGRIEMMEGAEVRLNHYGSFLHTDDWPGARSAIAGILSAVDAAKKPTVNLPSSSAPSAKILKNLETWEVATSQKLQALVEKLAIKAGYAVASPNLKALRLKSIRERAEQGDQSAAYQLGIDYMQGEGVNLDLAEAVKWLLIAAEKGYAKAQFVLGGSYLAGKGVAKDELQARKWFQLAANQGVAEAHFALSTISRYGPANELLVQNREETLRLLTKSAEGGYELAKHELAVFDLKWRAEQGDVDAQCRLGATYNDGRIVPRDQTAAVQWLSKASKGGSVPAKYSLGLLYLLGKGVPKDTSVAAGYFHETAQLGYARAQGKYADLLAKGDGVPKNLEQAHAWMLAAAKQNDAVSQFAVATQYMCGEGCDRDPIEAYVWMFHANTNGIAQAAHFCEDLAKEMSPEQLDHAKNRIATFYTTIG